MSTPYRRYTVEYLLGGHRRRDTVQAESEGHACRLVALCTGGTACKVIARAF
jgi:hypothetical protein